jgi:hypothetical protein
MPSGTMTARPAVLRWLVTPAAAISLAAGLGSVVPAPPAAAGVARTPGSPGSSTGPGTPVTAYVVSDDSGTVTPIATATNTAGPPITTGPDPDAIAITPVIVTHAPAFASSSALTVAHRARFSFTVTTTGSPAPTITAAGRLPSGVRFTDHTNGTATITGTPRNAAAGAYSLTLTAENKYGTATQAFTLTVTRAPAIQNFPAIHA